MSNPPACTSCSIKELIDHELTGTPHTDCQPEPYSPEQQNSGEPHALNSDALVNTLTAALGTNSTTTTTL